MTASAPGRPPPAPTRSDPPLSVLVTAPDPARVGGISNYLSVCRPYQDDGIEFVFRGARAGERGALRAVWRALRDAARLAARILFGGHDVVHQNTSLGMRGLLRDVPVLLFARMARKPVLVFFHGWDHALADRVHGSLLWLMRHTYFRAHGIVVLAAEFGERLRKWGYAGPLHLETTAVDDAFHPLPSETGAHEPGVQVLFMARLEPEKGCMLAIQAVERLAERGLPVRLVVAGDGSARADAERYVRERGLGFVRFDGFVVGPARLALLQASHVYLFPTSYGEGMPTSVLEAMACGLPVVTRPVGGLRDFFEGGRMGFLTESVEPDAFAALLEPLVTDPSRRAEIGAYNAEYARHRFAASTVARRLRALYRATARTA